jgi:hypothetical protein
MSLATTGGIGAAGGAGGPGAMAMAHQAHQMQNAAPPPPDAGDYADTGHGASMPSAGVLGADLMDKQHGLSLKYVRNSSELPIVAIDLFSSEPLVAYFPKKPEDPSIGVPPVLVGKMKAKIALKASEQSHKTFRKYLNHSKPYSSLKADCLARLDEKDGVVVIEEPYHWLGMRRLEEAPDFLAKAVADNSKHVANGSLEGPEPLGNDNDRVVYKVALNPSKKPITVLPEEAVELLLRQAQHHVHAKLVHTLKDEVAQQHADETISLYPTAIAVPAWAAHDSSVEAVLEAAGNGGVFFQRSVCALAGALLPPLGEGSSGRPNPLLDRLEAVRAHMAKEYQRMSAKDPDAVYSDELTLILLGMTSDGFEATAVQVSGIQDDPDTCLFGNIKVLSNVSYMSSDPIGQVKRCTSELEASVQQIAPEADGPCAIVLYGTPAEQEKILKQWKKNLVDSSTEWKNVPAITSKSDCIALGTALLGAVTHGRQVILVSKSDDNSGKHRAELGIRVQNVAPAAVGYRINYRGGDDEAWTPVKTIFDFDRRIPAGPYPLEFSAAECAVHRASAGGDKMAQLSDEDFTKVTKEMQTKKHIPAREEAALALRLEIVQKWTRDGEWIKVGETMEPLVKLDEENLDSDGEAKKVACESVTLDISLGVHGMLTSSLEGER